MCLLTTLGTSSGAKSRVNQAVRVRSCEKIAEIARLTDESVCPTLARIGLRFCRAGAFACQPIVSRLLTVVAPNGAGPPSSNITGRQMRARLKLCPKRAAATGTYAILAPMVRGMGKVYKAWDTRL